MDWNEASTSGSKSSRNDLYLHDDDYQNSFLLVRGWDHNRNDYHLDYLARDVWTVADSGFAGFVCNVRIGATMGAE